MTERELAGELEKEFDRCPRCRGHRLGVDDRDGSDTEKTLTLAMRCKVCQLRWSEKYRLVDVYGFVE